MQHSRQEVIQRTIREFELLDHPVANLSEKEWLQLVPRPEGKDPWTVKDAVAHIVNEEWTRRCLPNGYKTPTNSQANGGLV